MSARGLVGEHELGLIMREALVINTSRGPIIDEAALIVALRNGTIAGAGPDVFDHEILAADHPFRSMENLTLTPHLGYATPETLKIFLGGMPGTIAAFAAAVAGQQPLRIFGERKGGGLMAAYIIAILERKKDAAALAE